MTTDRPERSGAPPEARTVDMSPEGIDRRMRELAQLHRLGLAIGKARRLGKLRDLRGSGGLDPS